jgi:hypothetical protein
VSSGHIPAKDEPGPDEILRASREAVFENQNALVLQVAPHALLLSQSLHLPLQLGAQGCNSSVKRYPSSFGPSHSKDRSACRSNG